MMRRRKWQDYYVKDGSKGPMIWQVKHITVYLADERGLPSRPYHLLVARNALVHNQVKCFVSNVLPGTLMGLPVSNRRKVGTTSSHHGLYDQGLTRATMAITERRETVRWSPALIERQKA